MAEKNFILIPIWRMMDTHRHVDELHLHISQYGNRYCTFNNKDAHGTWLYNEPKTPACFLDIKFNARFGEPVEDCDHDPDHGKWTRFQRIPGTMTWVRCETNQARGWTCILAPIKGPAPPAQPAIEE